MLLDEIYERITWRTCLESLNSSAFLSILILGFLRHCYRGVSCLQDTEDSIRGHKYEVALESA